MVFSNYNNWSLPMTSIQSDTAGTTPVLPPIQLNQDKPSSLCSRMAYGVVNCAKKFGLGVAAAGIITPLTTGTAYLAQLSGLIPEVTRESNIIGTITNLQNMGLKNFNIDSLLNATCYLEEYTKQYNSHFPSMTHLHQTPLSMKVITGATVGVIVPFSEEILFRGLMQDVLLMRIPKFIVKKIAPGKETVLDSSVAKAARIALTAAAFSAYHFQNQGLFSDSYVTMQLVSTFVMGIGFGLLKESKAGLLGSIGAHMANNFVAIAPTLWSC